MTKIALLAALLLLPLPALAQDQAPPPADAAPPAPVAAPPGNPPMSGPQLLIATSMGDITLQLDAVHAPKSVANILRYVREKHYDNTVFYRVVKGFVIQMGSWDAKGQGRPMHPGPVPFEGTNGLKNLRGTVALGHGDAPDSAGPDFFINLVDDPGLDPNPATGTIGYAVFGQVTSGMEVVDAIGNVPVGQGLGPMPAAAPNDPVIVKKVSLLP
jgi:peptidyl-prolyl cis-trans isomerase A (cyclophilin A)